MTSTVNNRACAVATFRFISVRLMEMVARWTPTTAEMEAKVMFGRHIWDFAQMADALGKRTFELRRPEHYTLRPVDAYVALLDETSVVQATNERIAALYDGLLPGLLCRYRAYVKATDPILDEPTTVIVGRIIGDLERQRGDAAALQRELGLESSTKVLIADREKAIVDIIAKHSPA